jgi:hypothetical protein
LVQEVVADVPKNQSQAAANSSHGTLEALAGVGGQVKMI